MIGIHKKFWKLLLKRKVMLISLLVLLVTLPIFFLVTKYKSNAEASWYDGNWSHRKQLMFNNSAQSSNLSNFPVMIKLTDSNFPFSQAKSDGSDIRFTDSNGSTLIPYEIESYDSTAQTAVIWVNVPQINASSSTDSVFIYWGNPKASDAQSADNTWNSGYKGVYHLKDNAAATNVVDSSGNTNNLTSSSNTSSQYTNTSGKIGSGFLTMGTPQQLPDTANKSSELYPDIKLDSNNFPVVAYYNNTANDLIIVHCNDRDCTGDNENVNAPDTTSNTGSLPSLQLDANGYPVVSYYDVSATALNVLHCNDANCAGGDDSIQSPDSAGDVGSNSSLVLDSLGYPVISYYDTTNTNLKLVHCNDINCAGGDESIVTVDGATGTVGGAVHGISLFLDGSGYPVIAYYDNTNTDLKFVHCNDANCAGGDDTPITIVSTGDTGRTPTVRLDGSGYPIMTFEDWTNRDLYYLHCNDANCTGGDDTPVLIDATTGDFPWLELNNGGIPIIVYSTGQTYTRVAVCSDINCSTNTQTYLTIYNQYGSSLPVFDVASDNSIAIVNYNRGKNGRYDVNLFTTSHKLDRAYDSDFDFGTGSFSVSAWFKAHEVGQTQFNHILSRYDADQGYKLYLDYGGYPCFGIDDDSTWNPDDSACMSPSNYTANIDNGQGLSGREVAMVLDSSGYPIIAYFDASTDTNLEFIHCNDSTCSGGNENKYVLDSTGNVGSYPSIVLDGNGYPVISYHDSTNGALKVIHCGDANCSAGNTTNTIDSSGANVTGQYTSIKLDGSGYPVISYYDSTAQDLRIAHCNDVNCSGGDETLVTLDSTGAVGAYSSLQLDAAGYPVVSYQDTTNLDLKLVHCGDANCSAGNTISTIESVGQTGYYGSMQLDASGYPVIAYFYNTAFSLKLVHCNDVNCAGANETFNTVFDDYDAGNLYISLLLNSSGYPVILHTTQATWGQMLTTCNDVDCAGANETNNSIRQSPSNINYGSIALDSNGFIVIATRDGNGDLGLFRPGAATYSNSNTKDDGAWHHMVGVKNGTSSITLYVDGVAVASDATLAASGTLTSNSSSFNLAESITNGLSENGWGGWLDEVQIDNTARSADWIAAQYLSESNTFVSFGPIQSSPRGDNPIAYWKFDEGQGVVANNTVWEKTGTTINLMPNPSLETNTTGWIYAGGNGSLSRITTDRIYGGSSGSVIGATDYAWSRSRYNGMTVSPSTTYTLSGYVKAGSAGAVGKTIILGLIGNNSGETTGGTTTLTNSWQRVSIQKTTNASDTTLDAEVIWNFNSGGDTFYFDGVQLELSNTANLYCDGSLTGKGSHSWSGTAHTSTSTCDAGTDGQINNAVWRPKDQCINGKCLYFDGTGDNVEIGASKFDFLNNATIETWFKYTGTFDTNRALWGHYKDGSNRQVLFVGYPGGWGNKLVFENIVGGVNRGITSNATLTAGNWYHAAISCGADGMKMYLNGIIQTLNNATTDCLSTISGTSYNSIGQASIGSMSFNGFIDDVKIFPYVRTPIQIKNDFNSRGSTLGLSAQLGVSKESSSTFSNGLIGYWKMDESTWTGDCSTGSVLDSSGNSLNGSACPNGTAPSPEGGKFGNAAGLNGTSQYFNVGNIASGAKGSMGAWINPGSQYTLGHTVFAALNGGTTTSARYALVAHSPVDCSDQWYVLIANGTSYQHVCSGQTFNSTNFPSNRWTHLFATYDGTKVNFYKDGALISSVAQTISAVGSAQPFAIGQLGPAAGYYFNGSIDEVRLYNRDLSGKEVRDIYNWSPGLSAHWRLDEKTGITSVLDSSGNENTGVTEGSIASTDWVGGKYGSALNFDNSNNHIDAGDTSSLKLTSTGSVGAWVYPRSYPGVAQWKVIMNKGNWGAGRNYYSLYFDSTNIRADIGGASANNVITKAKETIPLNQWSHVVSTWDGTKFKFYINGSLQSSIDQTVIPDTSTYNFAFGALDDGTRPFDGVIDDVRVYNYARTSGQIAEDINAGHPLGGSPIASQLGYWKFDEGYGSTANNSGNLGSSLNGTLDNATWSMDGKYGKAISCELDNSEEVDIGSSTVSNETELTVSAWIKPESHTTTGGIIGEGGAYRLLITTAGKLQFFINGNPSDTGSTLTSANNVIVNGVWQHVAAVWNGSNATWGLYYNGKRISDNAAVNGTTSLDGADSDNPAICNYWNNYASARFDGLIDEVKLYSSALTSDEIKLDYNRGSAMVLGTLSDTSGAGGTVGDSSNSSIYCVPGDTNSCAPPVLELKMDEKTGTSTTYDTSGNAIDATLYSSPAWTLGKFGSGLNFNGTTQRMTTVANPLTNFSAAGQYAIEAWVKLDQYQPNGGTGGCCGSRIAYNNSGDGGFDWRIWNNGVVSFYRPTTWCAASSTQTVPLNEWVHLSATYNNQQVYLYMNGRQIASTNSCSYLDSSVGLTFNYPGGNHGLYGDMDNIQIYNYARTPAQIAWDYNRGGPIGHWKLDECTGTAANDSSGTSNTGTISIGATGSNTSTGTCTGASGEAWNDGAIGKFNSSLEFDGTDDYIYTADSPSLDNPFMSITAWIKTSRTTEQYISERAPYYFATGVQSGKLCFWLNSVAATWTCSTKTVTDNTWHFVTGTWDGTNKKLYIDGQLDTSDVGSGGVLGGSALGLNIGTRVTAGVPQNFFLGQIDDVRLFNYPLTLQQIKMVYNNGASVQFAPATGSP